MHPKGDQCFFFRNPSLHPVRINIQPSLPNGSKKEYVKWGLFFFNVFLISRTEIHGVEDKTQPKSYCVLPKYFCVFQTEFFQVIFQVVSSTSVALGIQSFYKM